MALKEAILGLVFDAPRTGYDIKRFYAETIHNFWNISDGQLYPTLRKMNDAGLISREVVVQERTANKHLYSITDEGKRVFLDWLREPVDKFQEMREPFLLKMFFFSRLSKEEVREHLTTQLNVQHRMAEMFRGVEESYKTELSDYQKLIAEVATVFMDFRVLWIARLIQLLESDRIDGKHRLLPTEMREVVVSFFQKIFADELDPELDRILDRLRPRKSAPQTDVTRGAS